MSREHPSVFQSQDRVPGVPGRWALGLWLTYRKLASSAWVPGQRFRMGLVGRQPFWFNMGFPNATFAPMVPQANQDDRVTCINDFLVLAIMGSATDQVTGATNFDFSALLFDSGAQELWTEVNEVGANISGTAQHPFILRRPHMVRAGSPLIARFHNFHAGNNNLPQISLFGVLNVPDCE
jgi:hypothetical protein